MALAMQRDLPAATVATAAAVATMDPLVRAFPTRHAYAWERNLYAYDLSRLQSAQRDLPAAIKTLRQLVSDQESLVAANTDRIDFVHDLARMKGTLGATLGQTDDENDVGPLLASSVELQLRVVAARPDDAAAAAQLANLRSNLALHKLHTDDVDGATAHITAAVAAFEQLLAQGQRDLVRDNQFPFTMQLAAQIAVVRNDAAAAVRHLERLQANAPLAKRALQEFGERLRLGTREDFQALLANAK